MDCAAPWVGGNDEPRNSDGTWVAGVERGPQKPFPFPVGAVFGNLTVLEWVREKPYGEWEYRPRVRCKCGWEGTVSRYHLRAGRTTRCNTCAKRASGDYTKRYWKYADVVPDDEHRRRLLNRISAAITRCHSLRGDKNYVGRGITVYAPWRASKREFLRYVITLPGWDRPELDMDRIDNDRGYEPGNLRFVSRRDNALNRRTVRALSARVAELEAEVARLRSAELRPPQPVHGLD